MNKVDLLNALDNEEIIIKDLAEINLGDYRALPIMDLSSYGKELIEQLTGIGSDVLSDIINGETKKKGGLKKSIKKNSLSHFGIEIKPKKDVSKKNLKDIKSMDLNDFAMFSAILIVINSKLNEIISREKSIVEFLELDKQTELKADYLTLNSIVKEYHHNFENEKFLSSREAQVIDIRRQAEHAVLFYKELAKKKLASFKKGIHVEIDKALKEIEERLNFYRLALYIYSYSSFMDVVLLENFSDKFINSVIEDISDHSKEYVEFYKADQETIKLMAEKSGKSQALKGVSSIMGAVGSLFHKVKADKQADKLKNTSKDMSEKRLSSIDNLLNKFEENKEAGVNDILQNLVYLKNLYSNESSIIIDSENIYIK